MVVDVEAAKVEIVEAVEVVVAGCDGSISSPSEKVSTGEYDG